ncbi:MAG: hypothetical protein ACYCS2_11530, partial [Acidimicrobiales bacterium]
TAGPPPGRRSPGRWSGLVAPAAVVVLAGLTVTPWLIRDAVVMHRFIPVTTQGGLVASGTYNDTAAHDPLHPGAWRPANFVPEYRPLLKGDEVTEEAALRRAALHYISEHPLYPFRVSGWNLLRLFDLTGLSDPRASWAANGYGPGLADLDPVGLAVVAGLILIGALSYLRRRAWPSRPGAWPSRPGTWPVWLAPFLVAAVTIPVLGESRLRVGIDPFLILAAGPGVWAIGSALTAGRGAGRAPGRAAPAGGSAAGACAGPCGSPRRRPTSVWGAAPSARPICWPGWAGVSTRSTWCWPGTCPTRPWPAGWPGSPKWPPRPAGYRPRWRGGGGAICGGRSSGAGRPRSTTAAGNGRSWAGTWGR